MSPARRTTNVSVISVAELLLHLFDLLFYFYSVGSFEKSSRIAVRINLGLSCKYSFENKSRIIV